MPNFEFDPAAKLRDYDDDDSQTIDLELMFDPSDDPRNPFPDAVLVGKVYAYRCGITYGKGGLGVTFCLAKGKHSEERFERPMTLTLDELRQLISELKQLERLLP